MEFNIEINCDNAAFDGGPENEVASILRALAEKLTWNGIGDYHLRDANGNKVGRAWLEGVRDEADEEDEDD